MWNNKNYPMEENANFEFVGIPVYQSVRKSQGEWQTNPSDPFLLSPDESMEYHFVGKYIELEIDRSLVFPFILSEADKEFNKSPEKEKVSVVISLDGKYKNGKKSKISASFAYCCYI